MARTTRQLKILSGAALSEPLDLGACNLLGFHLPAAFDKTKLTIQVSTDGRAWQDISSGASSAPGGSEWEQLCAAGRAFPLEGWVQTFSRWVRFRSGSAGSPANQGADRLLTEVVDNLHGQEHPTGIRGPKWNGIKRWDGGQGGN